MIFRRLIPFLLLLLFTIDFSRWIFYHEKNNEMHEFAKINENSGEDEKCEDENEDKFFKGIEIISSADKFNNVLNFIPYIEKSYCIKYSLKLERPPEVY